MNLMEQVVCDRCLEVMDWWFCRFRSQLVAVRAAAEGGPDLSVTVNGLKLPNPFVIGSGPPGTNYTVMKKAFDEGWGGVIAKTVCIP